MEGIFGPPNIQKQLAKRDVKGLIKALSYVKDGYVKDDCVRTRAAEALGEIGDTRAVEPLISALKSEERVEREVAAEALGTIGDTRAVEPLISALKDDGPYVRMAAAGALGKIKYDSSISLLIAALNDHDETVRYLVTMALGQTKDSRAVEPLMAALENSDNDTRYGVVIALGEIGDDRAVESLISMFKDERPSVREAAAKGLGEIRDDRAVEPLIALLEDCGESDFRGTISDALGKIGGTKANTALAIFMANEKEKKEEEKQKEIQQEQERIKRINRAQGEIKDLTVELINIGMSDGYLSMQPGGKFNSNRRHVKVRKIGNRLNRIGGLELMREVGYKITNSRGPIQGRELEAAWDGIGEWRG